MNVLMKTPYDVRIVNTSECHHFLRTGFRDKVQYFYTLLQHCNSGSVRPKLITPHVHAQVAGKKWSINATCDNNIDSE